jgi:hypothetical protein
MTAGAPPPRPRRRGHALAGGRSRARAEAASGVPAMVARAVRPAGEAAEQVLPQGGLAAEEMGAAGDVEDEALGGLQRHQRRVAVAEARRAAFEQPPRRRQARPRPPISSGNAGPRVGQGQIRAPAPAATRPLVPRGEAERIAAILRRPGPAGASAGAPDVAILPSRRSRSLARKGKPQGEIAALASGLALGCRVVSSRPAAA